MMVNQPYSITNILVPNNSEKLLTYTLFIAYEANCPALLSFTNKTFRSTKPAYRQWPPLQMYRGAYEFHIHRAYTIYGWALQEALQSGQMT